MDIRQAISFITGKAAKHPYPGHMRDARKIAADIIVLLKNEGDLLPLAEKELALFLGAGAVDTIVCRSGSGYVMAPYTINEIPISSNTGIQITSNWLKRYQESRVKKQIRKIRLCPNWIGHGLVIAF